MQRSAFTLIELLVVIGIIALLIGLLAPTLRNARDAALTTRCRAHLKSTGTAWAIYADQYPKAMPAAVGFPQPVGSAPGELTIMRVLDRYVSDRGVYACPSDDRDYFKQRGTSYEYLPGYAITLEPANAEYIAGVAQKQPEIIPILSEAEEFHAAADDVANPQLTVYYDAHVDWLWNDIPTVPPGPNP